jgi:hypothetical protein
MSASSRHSPAEVRHHWAGWLWVYMAFTAGAIALAVYQRVHGAW